MGSNLMSCVAHINRIYSVHPGGLPEPGRFTQKRVATAHARLQDPRPASNKRVLSRD